MKELINIDQYSMGRDKLYPEEWTLDVQNNAKILLQKINKLLNELGIKEAKVSSGFRPSAINSKTANAAKRSAHMIGRACDILDNENQDLAKLVASRPDLLRFYGLFMEDMNSTRGINTNWVHLDYMVRSDRPSRIFIP